LRKAVSGRHWYVSGFVGEKRIQLWFHSEREAKAAAANRNAEIKAHGTQIALSPVDRIQAIAAAEKLAPYGKSIAEAVDFFAAQLRQAGQQHRCTGTVRTCGGRIRAAAHRRRNFRAACLVYAVNAKEVFRSVQRQTLKLICRADIKAWLASEPLAVKTRNRHLGYLRNVFGLARQWNLLDADPFERVNGFNDPHARARQVQILAPEQLMKFLQAVDRDFVPFFALSAFSGSRRQEIIRLDWSEVKLDRNLIDIPFAKSKNRRRKLIELSENLKQWLSPFARESGSVMPRKKLQLAFASAAKSAGISPWPQNGLRHSFCSHAVALRGFEWTSMQADHSVQMLRKHYWEVVDRETAERDWAIRP
jgi:integrase